MSLAAAGDADASGRRPGGPGAVVSIRGVGKRYGPLVVLADCSLDALEGEILTLLGPSGCGKTTLLRCVAGFAAPDAGTILIDGRDAVAVPVNQRPVGVVFQSYALFPHLTVAGNVGYGLRMRRVPRAEIASRVAAALEAVSLSGFGDRYPAQLSGGQQQRVAIARVLILEPRVLLLDEPFSALDAKLRGAMQVELRALIKRLRITAIFVTHDQEEALTMSDRIAVMRSGRIEQLASPAEVFDRPASAYVADFVGASNFHDATAAEGWATLPDGSAVASDLEGAVRVMVRPHNLSLERGGAADAGWPATVLSRRHAGPLMEYEVAPAAGATLRVLALRGDAAQGLEIGDPVSLRVRDPAACIAFPPR